MATPCSLAGRRLLAIAAILAVSTLAAFAELPKPSGPINDFAGLLDQATIEELLTQVRGVEADTTAEIAVVTVTDLEGMSVEEYANRLFREWGIGQKGVKNGVLILVAPNEREMRIEVGYGLEPILPDGLAGAVIREQMTPEFKAGRYAEGIRAGTARVADIIRKNHTLTAEERALLEKANANEPPIWLLAPFFGIFVVIGSASVANGFRQKEWFWLLFGGPFAGLPLLMSLIFSRTVFYIEAVLGAVVFLVALLRKRQPAEQFDSDGAALPSRGWRMGADSGSSSSSSSDASGSSSSSSDSFGGGDSGGGGASGRW